VPTRSGEEAALFSRASPHTLMLLLSVDGESDESARGCDEQAAIESSSP
jgi:hypothetical protein